MPKETGKDRRTTDKTVRVSSVASTEAQNSLGEILGRVTRGERVFITRYGRRQAVLLSAEAYAALMGRAPVDLVELEEEFDERMERMQTPEHQPPPMRSFGCPRRSWEKPRRRTRRQSGPKKARPNQWPRDKARSPSSPV